MDVTSLRHEHFSTWLLNFSAPQMLRARAWSLPKVSPGASRGCHCSLIIIIIMAEANIDTIC